MFHLHGPTVSLLKLSSSSWNDQESDMLQALAVVILSLGFLAQWTLNISSPVILLRLQVSRGDNLSVYESGAKGQSPWPLQSSAARLTALLLYV